MKLNMFVCLGFSDSTPPSYTEVFLEKLKLDFEEDNIDFSYILNNNLLTLNIEDFRYHIGFTDSKSDLKDWFQMAKDFELDSDKKLSHLNNVVNPDIIKKYIGFSDRDKHYAAITPYIIKRMREINGIDIYTFY